MGRDITKCHPELQKKAALLVEKCKAQGLTIKITECFRTVAEQDALYAQGRTKPGSIVTNAKGTSYSSHHQWGTAFDFCRNDGTGAYNESGQFFEKVGAIGKSLGLEWGGDWKSPVDKPHFQLPYWGSTTAKLKQTYGTPNKFRATWPGDSDTPDPKIIEIQNWCNKYSNTGIYADGYYGPQTRRALVKSLQLYLNKATLANLALDGVWGRKTKAACVTATDRGDHVYIAQAALYCHGYDPGVLDGIDGKNTRAAAKAFQKDHGLTADGIVGKNTFEKLLTT